MCLVGAERNHLPLDRCRVDTRRRCGRCRRTGGRQLFARLIASGDEDAADSHRDGDVVIMNRSMLDDPAQHDVAARFMRATYRGLQFLLDEPQRSAEIAVQHAVDAPNLTVDQALFRFERQRFLITGEDESQPLMQMDPAFWDDNTAILAQYGFMDTLNCQ